VQGGYHPLARHDQEDPSLPLRAVPYRLEEAGRALEPRIRGFFLMRLVLSILA
jgi:hypothetical protein